MGNLNIQGVDHTLTPKLLFNRRKCRALYENVYLLSFLVSLDSVTDLECAPYSGP